MPEKRTAYVPSMEDAAVKGKTGRDWAGWFSMEMGFYAKGRGKAQIAVQINKLPSRDAVETERAAWGAAVEKLRGLLVGGEGASGALSGSGKSSARATTKGSASSAELAKSFASVVKAFAKDPVVTPPGPGKAFGSGALKVGKKIFAMISSRDQFVVKLPAARASDLVTTGRGTYFDAGRAKPMKEWVVVTAGERLWIPLAKEARDFAAEKH